MSEGSPAIRRRWRWAWILVIVVVLGLFTLLQLNPDPECPVITFPFGAQSLSFDQSGKLLMILHGGVIDVRNVEDGKQIAAIDSRPQAITSLALDKERTFGCFGTYGGQIGIFNAHSFDTTFRSSITSENVASLAISSKKHVLIAYSWDGYLRIVQLPNGNILGKLQWGYLYSMTISADEELVALDKSMDNRPAELRIGKLESPKDLEEWTITLPEVDGLAFLGVTHILAVAKPSELSLWDLDAKKEVDKISHPGRSPMAASDDGKVLAVAGHMTLYIILTNPLRVVRIVGACRDMGIEAMAISPDGKYLAASCYGLQGVPGYEKTKVWRLDTLLGK